MKFQGTSEQETTLNFWSAQVPLNEMETFISMGAHAGNLHAVTFSGPCGQHGHQQSDCPHRAHRTADDDNFAGAPPLIARRGAPLLHPFAAQPPPSLHSLMKDLHLEYAARMADVEYHYYAGAPGGLVQPTAIVPELEMQPPTQAGLHLLHGSATPPALHPGPMTMALPSIVCDRYRAQQASVAAEQDPQATVFEGERYYWN